MNCDETDTQAVVDETMLTAARSFSIPYRSAITSGHKKAVGARAAAMVYSTFMADQTVESVADAMDMDHSTVSYHRNNHDSRLESDRMYRSGWNSLVEALD